MQKHNDQDQSNWLSPSTYAQTYFHGTEDYGNPGKLLQVEIFPGY
ncbi:MAG: hypothetical protein RLQ12_02825 [Cyclobacteriaceae bacterium]